MRNALIALFTFFAVAFDVATAIAAQRPTPSNILVPYGTKISGTVSCFGDIKGFQVQWVREGNGSCKITVNLNSLNTALHAGIREGFIEIFGGKCDDDSLGRRGIMPYELKDEILHLYPWRKTCDTKSWGRGQTTAEMLQEQQQAANNKKLRKTPPPAKTVALSPKPAVATVKKPQAVSNSSSPKPDCNCSTTWNIIIPGGTAILPTGGLHIK